jgi:hypothetical protein
MVSQWEDWSSWSQNGDDAWEAFLASVKYAHEFQVQHRTQGIIRVGKLGGGKGERISSAYISKCILVLPLPSL